MIQLGEHFAAKGSANHSEWLRQQRWFIKARDDQQRREKAQDRLDDDLSALAAGAVAASAEQIAKFEKKLDRYDEATVRALLENQEQLDIVNARIDALLEDAYVMDDGRRVFRTRNGEQVFDEHGAEVSAVELDFDLIPETAPKWEEYQPDLELRERLMNERQALIEYQERLDVAREEVADGEISEADLEALDAELDDLMPNAVRKYASDPAADKPDISREGSVQSPTPAGLQLSATEKFMTLGR